VLLSDLLFPCPPASAGLLAEIDGFFGAGSATPRLARVLADRRDMEGRALRSRARRG
jgi:hypothetical protein